ncbi:hypothetical protein ACFY71_23115 [Streptomyces cinerochromogenes]
MNTPSESHISLPRIHAEYSRPLADKRGVDTSAGESVWAEVWLSPATER